MRAADAMQLGKHTGDTHATGRVRVTAHTYLRLALYRTCNDERAKEREGAQGRRDSRARGVMRETFQSEEVGRCYACAS